MTCTITSSRGAGPHPRAVGGPVARERGHLVPLHRRAPRRPPPRASPRRAPGPRHGRRRAARAAALGAGGRLGLHEQGEGLLELEAPHAARRPSLRGSAGRRWSRGRWRGRAGPPGPGGARPEKTGPPMASALPRWRAPPGRGCPRRPLLQLVHRPARDAAAGSAGARDQLDAGLVELAREGAAPRTPPPPRRTRRRRSSGRPRGPPARPPGTWDRGRPGPRAPRQRRHGGCAPSP